MIAFFLFGIYCVCFSSSIDAMETAVLKHTDFDVYLYSHTLNPLEKLKKPLGKAFLRNAKQEFSVQGKWDYQEDNTVTHVTPATLKLWIDISPQGNSSRKVHFKTIEKNILHSQIKLRGLSTHDEIFFEEGRIFEAQHLQSRFVVPQISKTRKAYSYEEQSLISGKGVPKEFQGYDVVLVEALVEGEVPRYFSGKRQLSPGDKKKIGLIKEQLIYSDGRDLYLPYVVETVYTHCANEIPFLIIAVDKQGKLAVSPNVRFLNELGHHTSVSGACFPEGVWQKQWEVNCTGERLEKWVPIIAHAKITENEGFTIAVPHYDQTFLPAFGAVDRLFFERCLDSSNLLSQSYSIESGVENAQQNLFSRFAEMYMHYAINQLYCHGFPVLPKKNKKSRTDFSNELEKLLTKTIAHNALDASSNRALIAAAKLLLAYCKERFGEPSLAASHYCDLCDHPENESFKFVKAAAACLLGDLYFRNQQLLLSDGKPIPHEAMYYATFAVRHQDVNRWAQQKAMIAYGKLNNALRFQESRQRFAPGGSRKTRYFSPVAMSSLYLSMASAPEVHTAAALLSRFVSRNDHLSAVRLLCNQLQVAPDTLDATGYTPLHRIAVTPLNELSEVWAMKYMELLLEHGANINAQVAVVERHYRIPLENNQRRPAFLSPESRHTRRTPIQIALAEKKLLCALFLAERGADLQIPSDSNFKADELQEDARNLLMHLRKKAGLSELW